MGAGAARWVSRSDCLAGAGGPTQCFVSGLAAGCEWVHGEPGEHAVGYRLRPQAQVAEAALLAALSAPRGLEEASLLAAVAEHVRPDTRLAEALDGLAQAAGVRAAARALGVSVRTLERLLQATTGRTPGFWHGLARVRAAGLAILSEPLADLAARHGYADQAHMSRDFRRWFGLSPTALRASPLWRARLAVPAYVSAPIGVHSSTRKPSGSAT